MRTHKTAGAGIEMTRRGGARVWVFGAKPSPFLGILRAVRGVGRGFDKKAADDGGLRGRFGGAKNLSFASTKSIKSGLKI